MPTQTTLFGSGRTDEPQAKARPKAKARTPRSPTRRTRAERAPAADAVDAVDAADAPEATDAADASDELPAEPPRAPRTSGRTASRTAARAAGPAGGDSRQRTVAHELAAQAREISVSEFFAKNRHLLGFDSKRKALLTTVKEAVDNALDACEEAGILPDLAVSVKAVPGHEDRYQVTVSDNGPGILPDQIDLVFAKLLYGSKFHRLRQSRGQQGIGISAAGMYGQMTTGVPTLIRSRIGRKHDAIEVGVRIDTAHNQPVRTRHAVIEWDREHGTEVTIVLEGSYAKGRGSVDEYIAQTAISNPHVRVLYHAPDSEQPQLFERATRVLPAQPVAIKPHPYGVELGLLMKMMKGTSAKSLAGFLRNDFSRVSARLAEEICAAAGLDPESRVKSLEHKSAEALYKAIPGIKLMAPPTNCLSPIGEELVRAGLEKEIGQAEFFVSRTRPPAVYRGNPFQIEAGVALGGSLAADEPVRVLRFANRVPLQYAPGGCAITKAVTSVDWKTYGLQQPKGAVPIGPVILMVHIASAWVPFTSESKEAVASYPEILKELRLGLQEVGRLMQRYLRRRARVADELKKRGYIEKYIPHIGQALRDILALDAKQTDAVVTELRDSLERSRKL